MISEKNCMVSNDRRLSEIFNCYSFRSKTNIISTTTSFPKSIETFKDHPSIKKTFSLQREECQFKFYSVSQNGVRYIALNMNEKR